MDTNLIQNKMNGVESEVYVSTYDPDCVEIHSDTSDFDFERNSDMKIENPSRCRDKKHKEIHLLKHKLMSSHSSVYFNVINSVELEKIKKTNLRSKEICQDRLRFCKEKIFKNSCNSIDDESIDISGRSQNNQIDKHIRGESKSADQYFLYDTNNIDTTSYIVTNKTTNDSNSSGNYYFNSENKRADHDGNKNIRPDNHYRIDNNSSDHNNRCKSKKIDRYLNSESIRTENHSPSDRKLIDNRIRRQDNRADHYIHCEDNRIHNYYNRMENNVTDHNESVRPESLSCGENNWPENEKKINSPISISANHAQANEKIKENKKNKRKKVYDDLEKGILHSSSTRWPLLKQKCMPRLCNILGRFGSHAIGHKNTHDKCKWCSPFDDVTLLYCSKCKTTKTKKSPIQVVQSIHTLNGNTHNPTPFDKVKYIQYGGPRVLQAADMGNNLLLRCSNCSMSSTTDSEMNEKFRQKLEKRFKKKMIKYFNRQIKKGSVKEKSRQYPYQDVNYASMDVKTSPCSASSHFLDSIFRGINKKYQDKQTESIGDSNRKNPNLNTLNACVGGSDGIHELVGCHGSNYNLSSSNLYSKHDNKCHSSCGINKQQQKLKPTARIEPIVGFGCNCFQRQGENESVLNKPPPRPIQQPCRMTPMYNPPVPIRPAPPRKHPVNSKVECLCKKEKVVHRPIRPIHPCLPPQPPPPPPPPRQKPVGQESCDRCCQQPHAKILQAVQKQYNGEIICIHNPPCVLINGCLNLPQNIVRNKTTAVYSAAQADRMPFLRNKPVNPGLGNVKISNICEKCARNRSSLLHRGQMSNNIRTTTQGINTCKPYVYDKPLNESNKYQPNVDNSPEKVPKILETQSIQVEMSNEDNEMKSEDNTKIKPDNTDIPKNVSHATAPSGDVNTTTQVRYRHSSFCHNSCETRCLYKPDYTTPQLSQGLNSELPICLMNYSDFPVIKENASAQVTPEADPKLENYCVHVPICQKLRNCKVETENIDEIPTTLSYKSQTRNMNLISLTVKETVSVQTTGGHSTKSFRIYLPKKKISKCVSDKFSRKRIQQNEVPNILHTAKHLVALTAVEEVSTQVRERNRDINFRHKPKREVLSTGDASTQVRRKKRQLICRHHPECVLVHECVGNKLTDSVITYEDIPECSHKRCCELIPACLARNVKDVKAVSSQRPPNTCHII